MKNKILNNIKKELEQSDSFFDNEINIVMDVISNNLDKYFDKTNNISQLEKIKKVILKKVGNKEC